MGLLLLALIGLIGAEKINVCYYTNWSQYRKPDSEAFFPEDIDPALCTHIHFAFAHVTDDGTNLRKWEYNDHEMYKRVMELRRQKPS